MTTVVTTDVADGTTIDASDLNNNLTAIRNVVNGNLDNGNIAVAAAIAITKLAGYPGDGAKYLRGDGVWSALPAGGAVPPSSIVGYPGDASKFLRGDGVWATPPTVGAVAYGTSLPGSPVDGQEAILVDSTTNPSYQWRFRYNAASVSAFKWEFIGGSFARATVDAQAQVTSPTYVDMGGPALTLPRAGDYDINISFQTGLGDGQAVMSYDIGGVAAVDADSVWGIGGGYQTSSFSTDNTPGGARRKTGVAAGALAARYRSGTGSGMIRSRSITALPVRVA